MRRPDNVLCCLEAQNKNAKNAQGRRPMLTRRSILLASIAAGVTMPNRTVLAPAAQPSTPVNFDIPPGACHGHTHIPGDPQKLPFFSTPVYTPELTWPH